MCSVTAVSISLAAILRSQTFIFSRVFYYFKVGALRIIERIYFLFPVLLTCFLFVSSPHYTCGLDYFCYHSRHTLVINHSLNMVASKGHGSCAQAPSSARFRWIVGQESFQTWSCHCLASRNKLLLSTVNLNYLHCWKLEVCEHFLLQLWWWTVIIESVFLPSATLKLERSCSLIIGKQNYELTRLIQHFLLHH